jgi:hypothetical protein
MKMIRSCMTQSTSVASGYLPLTDQELLTVISDLSSVSWENRRNAPAYLLIPHLCLKRHIFRFWSFILNKNGPKACFKLIMWLFQGETYPASHTKSIPMARVGGGKESKTYHNLQGQRRTHFEKCLCVCVWVCV